MKNRIYAILLSVLMLLPVILFLSCKGSKYEIALVTDTSGVDGKTASQYIWEGITAYAVKHGISCVYFTPKNSEKASVSASVENAVSSGAKTVFVCGEAEGETYDGYPEVRFIVFGAGKDKKSNVKYIEFSKIQAGFAAGYAAVADGYTKLGYIGEGTDYLSGYLQGAEFASKENDTVFGFDLKIIKETDEAQKIKQAADEMFKNGAEIIFADSDKTAVPVSNAAKDNKGKVIGAGTDQRYRSERVVTSACCHYAYVSGEITAAILENRYFDTSYGLNNGGVGLPLNVENDLNGDPYDRFDSFDKAQYKHLIEKVEGGAAKINESAITDTSPAAIMRLLGFDHAVYGFEDADITE